MMCNFEIKVQMPPKSPKKPDIKVHIPLHPPKKPKIKVRSRLQSPKKLETEILTPPQSQIPERNKNSASSYPSSPSSPSTPGSLLREPFHKVLNIFETSKFRDPMIPLSLSGSYIMEYASEDPS
jgi:hypothetical protein